MNVGHRKKEKLYQIERDMINVRSVYAMRRCGKRHQGLRRFLMLMNHPPPMSEKNDLSHLVKQYDELQQNQCIGGNS